MAKHIVSTLSADTRYAAWVTNHGVGSIERSVLVRGKAGIALRGGGPGQLVYTPSGIRTEVSDADAEFLSNHKMFKQHQERGHVRIENIARDADTVADNKMDKDEGSAPKTPSDVKKENDELAKKTGGDDSLQAVTNKKK